MRIPGFSSLSLLLLLSSTCINADPSPGSGAGGLYPPGLLPLINRANALLSSGHFNEAAKAYTEAIEQSPSDYLLYYKRATALLSLSRHSAALEDFDRVLTLTSNTFDNAHLMRARIHTKEGDFALARTSLSRYTASMSAQGRPVDSAATELLNSVEEAEKLLAKARLEKQAHLWTACAESCSSILRGAASHSIEVRQMRVECQLAAGDVEGSVGDLTRLAVLLPPSASMELQARIWRLSYFLLPPARGDDGPGSATVLAPLKACLHFDPDSKECLSLHRLAKSLEKSFGKLEESLQAQDWRTVVGLLTDSGKGKEKDLWGRYEKAMEENTSRKQLLGISTSSSSKRKEPSIPLPDPKMQSPRRQILLRALCKSYTSIGTAASLRQADKWCSLLMEMDGCHEDADGLVGKAEYLLSTEDDVDPSSAGGTSSEGKWDDAIRMLERAFESSGRSNRDIHAKLSAAKRKIKQGRRKDYYKVLGVDRDADEKTIKKAFRKAAKSAHPDKGGSEAKMAAVNEAYEVLSDPELRARFDAGDDPNDPSGGAGGHPFPGGFPGGAFHFQSSGGGGGGGHPFAQFFQQSGGGFPGGGAYGPGQGGFKFQWSG